MTGPYCARAFPVGGGNPFSGRPRRSLPRARRFTIRKHGHRRFQLIRSVPSGRTSRTVRSRCIPHRRAPSTCTYYSIFFFFFLVARLIILSARTNRFLHLVVLIISVLKLPRVRYTCHLSTNRVTRMKWFFFFSPPTQYPNTYRFPQNQQCSGCFSRYSPNNCSKFRFTQSGWICNNVCRRFFFNFSFHNRKKKLEWKCLITGNI